MPKHHLPNESLDDLLLIVLTTIIKVNLKQLRQSHADVFSTITIFLKDDPKSLEATGDSGQEDG